MKSKYTYDEVKQEFEEKGYDLISTEYATGSDKLAFRCRKHNDFGVQYIDFYHLHHRNQGCKKCSRERWKNNRVLEDELKSICESKGFRYVSTEYQILPGRNASGAVVNFICLQHENKGVQAMPLGNLKRVKVGCQYCYGRNYSFEESVDVIYSKNNNVEVLDVDKSGKQMMYVCRCKKHDRIFKAPRYALVSNKGCLECGLEKLSIQMTKSHEEYVADLQKVNPHLEVVSEYISSKDAIICRCTLHNRTFLRDAASLLIRKTGCNICYKENMLARSPINELVIANRLCGKGFSNVELIGKYKGRCEKTTFLCRICGQEWIDLPVYVCKRGCKLCNSNSTENDIARHLMSMNVRFVRQHSFDDCRDKKPLPFDFYLPDRNIIIEYDGEQHFRPVRWTQSSDFDAESYFLYTKRHDEIKNHYCCSHGIYLIRIPYWEKGSFKERLFRELSYKLTA